MRPPKTADENLFSPFISPLFFRSPPMKPATPKANICHGVHGPWPKMKLLTKPLTAPVRNPAEGPKAIPDIITIPVMGLNCGSMTKAALETTAMAQRTAMLTISLACGLRLSNPTKKGIIAYAIIRQAAYVKPPVSQRPRYHQGCRNKHDHYQKTDDIPSAHSPFSSFPAEFARASPSPRFILHRLMRSSSVTAFSNM